MATVCLLHYSESSVRVRLLYLFYDHILSSCLEDCLAQSPPEVSIAEMKIKQIK